MSVDDRLRGALRHQADAFAPEVEAALDRVHGRGRIARWRSPAIAIAASVAAVGAVSGALVALDEAGGPGQPPTDQRTGLPAETAIDPPERPLRGTITAQVDRPEGLAGRWTLGLNGNGTIDVTPPARFEGEVSRPLFTADAGSFRTSLFEDDLCVGEGSGIYSWLRIRDRIDFVTISDTCTERARFFADSSWTASTEDAAGD